MWQTYARSPHSSPALTAIFAKIGVSDINSNLATAIRTAAILAIAWAAAFATCDVSQMRRISGHAFLFLILSGCATGLSWLFYFKALKLGGRLESGAGGQAERGVYNGSRLSDTRRAAVAESCRRMRADIRRSARNNNLIGPILHLENAV